MLFCENLRTLLFFLLYTLVRLETRLTHVYPEVIKPFTLTVYIFKSKPKPNLTFLTHKKTKYVV